MSSPNVPFNLKGNKTKPFIFFCFFPVPLLTPTHADFPSVPKLDLPGQVLVAEGAAGWALYTINTEIAFFKSFPNPPIFLILLLNLNEAEIQ